MIHGLALGPVSPLASGRRWLATLARLASDELELRLQARRAREAAEAEARLRRAQEAAGGVAFEANGRAAFTVSDTNVLVYRGGAERPVRERHLTWIDRRGTVVKVVGPPVTSATVRLSPDGTHVALIGLATPEEVDEAAALAL